MPRKMFKNPRLETFRISWNLGKLFLVTSRKKLFKNACLGTLQSSSWECPDFFLIHALAFGNILGPEKFSLGTSRKIRFKNPRLGNLKNFSWECLASFLSPCLKTLRIPWDLEKHSLGMSRKKLLKNPCLGALRIPWDLEKFSLGMSRKFCLKIHALRIPWDLPKNNSKIEILKIV